jgi:hypothetical protein
LLTASHWFHSPKYKPIQGLFSELKHQNPKQEVKSLSSQGAKENSASSSNNKGKSAEVILLHIPELLHDVSAQPERQHSQLSSACSMPHI